WEKDFTVDKAATCTEKGEKSIHCTRCDVREQVTEIPALEHKYGDWKVTKEATCTEAGSRTKECSVCHDVVTEAIPALGHDWKSSYTINKVATCTEDGIKSIDCRRCSEQKDIVKIPALGHNYGEWTITKEATCTDKGIHTKVCMRCPDQVSEEIPALGHSAGDWEVEKAPTIFAKGVEVKKCERCDIVLEKRDIKKKKAKVKLNAKSTTMQVKKTSTALKVKSSSTGDTVSKWLSANKKIAVVDKKTGKITAKSVGTTYITVTMKSGVSAKCKVIVQENAVATSKVSFGSEKINLKMGKSVKLQVLRTPISANDKLEFTSSKEKVAEVNSKGKVTAKKKGYTTITVRTATGKKATCKIYVS
ncbi:Ig domain-containing protein, partial [uncultured Robinsoniella sp.]